MTVRDRTKTCEQSNENKDKRFGFKHYTGKIQPCRIPNKSTN